MHDLHYKYEVEILNQPYVIDEEAQYAQTAVVKFFDPHGKIRERQEYGVVTTQEVYAKILAGSAIDLTNCYVHNFSLSEYRKSNNVSETGIVGLVDFNAINAFFDTDSAIDFTYSRFVGTHVSFCNTHFGNGDLSFYKAKFDNASVDFSNVKFGNGNKSFQFTDFGNEDTSFQNARFYDGDTLFINAKFGKGNVSFREVDFGLGDVGFHFSTFDDGDIFFDKMTFRGNQVDFRKIEFGNGRIDFRRTDFGDAKVFFEECEFGEGRKNFRRVRFGNGKVSFEMANLGKGELTFERTEFGSGPLSFYKAHLDEISLKSCHLDNYVDLRVQRANKIDLSDTIVRDIIDLRPGYSGAEIRELNIHGVRDLGRIFIDWKENNAKELIGRQDSSYREKADQYLILKEDFRESGKYDSEDEAYVVFKRLELKAHIQEAIEKNPANAIWVYPSAFARWLIFDKMGRYATDPVRVLGSMLVIYTLFSFVYLLLAQFGEVTPVNSSLGDPELLGMWGKCFYYSAITFLTIGYGDYFPMGPAKWIAAIEGFVGLFLMAYFTVAFVRKILR